jgi:hypothetical protein
LSRMFFLFACFARQTVHHPTLRSAAHSPHCSKFASRLPRTSSPAASCEKASSWAKGAQRRHRRHLPSLRFTAVGHCVGFRRLLGVNDGIAMLPYMCGGYNSRPSPRQCCHSNYGGWRCLMFVTLLVFCSGLDAVQGVNSRALSNLDNLPAKANCR